ncbi:response regulator [Fibrella sp. HMF5405]|uniref:Response regulator n=2 Tax=Fibrella forsythiae TaxID=2817061 RepID=A0ABS3JSF2_9BACT|nr:response regulator [Fibrella forsythiae]
MAHPQPTSRLPEDTVPALIWVVDDDQDDQCLLQEALTHLVSPVTARYLSDGDELLPALALATVLPKLILLDLNMQRQGGLETLQALRAASAYQHLPVVVLTTSEAQLDRDKSFQLGADDFLTKPVRQADSVLMLEKLTLDWHLTVN